MASEMQFDVFLSHNNADKRTARQLQKKLRERGLRVWLDESELIPGRPWQDALESIISSVSAVAVLLGESGIGPWENHEVRACLSEAVERGQSVIPVLLPRAPNEPRLPPFLKQFTWVDLRQGLRKKGIDQLQWGITGGKVCQDAVQNPAQLALAQTQPLFRVVSPDSKPPRRPTLLRDLTSSIAAGELKDSRVAPLVLTVLKDEKQLEVVSRQ